MLRFWIIQQVQLPRPASRLGVMNKRMREVHDAPKISDETPRRLWLPSAEIRKTESEPDLKASLGRFHLEHMEFEMCVRYLSQEVIYCSCI